MIGQAQVGLRERKKQKTRETIARVALDLFARNGYQQTTIAQIADAADVSPRTVSTYFPAKEELVFFLSRTSKDRLAESIRERPAGQDTMAAMRSWVVGEQDILESDHEQFECQRQVIDSDEALLAHERAQLREFELMMAEGFATDLGLDPDDLQPRMAAAAAVAVFDVLRAEREASGRHEHPEMDEMMRILDQALSFITGGVAAMRGSGETTP